MYQVLVILQFLFAVANVYGQWGGNLMGSPQVMFSNNDRRIGKVNSFGNKNPFNFKQNLNWNSPVNEPSILIDQGPYSNSEKNFFIDVSNLKPNINLSPNDKLESWNPYTKNNENSFYMNPETNKNYKQDYKDNDDEVIIDSEKTKKKFIPQTWQLEEKVKKNTSSANSPFSSTGNADSNRLQSFYNNDSKYFPESENSIKSPNNNQNSNSFFTSSNNLIPANTDDDFNKWDSKNKKKIDSKENSGFWSKPQSKNENGYSQNWLTNKKNITNFSINTESKKWKTASTTPKLFVNEKNENSKTESSKFKKQMDKTSSSIKDLSILDELDKNDWYFGSEADFPEIDSYSNINIDVSKLWDFDKKKGLSGRRKRKSREVEVNCKCVDISLCSEENVIVTKEDVEANGWRIIEPPKCKKLTEVCCTHPKSKYTSTYKQSLEKKPYFLECGQRTLSENLLENIEDNNIVVPGELPWTLKLENLRSGISCGASLVHPQLALTVAHCVTRTRFEDLIITTSSWNSNEEPFQQRNVSKIIIHPGFSEENPRNDIALLVMDKPFKLTNNVNTICLPVTNDKWFSSRCFVAGMNSKGDITKMLQKGLVSFMPQNECQNILLNTYLWHNYVLHNSFVCATENKMKNLCLGDEGSAVICPSKKFANTYLQTGIVSKSLNCDKFGQPGIFTNILKFLDWINEYIFKMEISDDMKAKKLHYLKIIH